MAFLRWQGAPLPVACDSVQDTMGLAFQRWSNLNAPYAWCRKVAARRYARHLAAVRDTPTGDGGSGAGHALSADSELELLEQRHAVLRVLDRLPLRQRQVMAWTYDGATPAEIAENLKITKEAVRSNLYEARTALRTFLDEAGGGLP